MALWMLSIAIMPADAEHPHGHDKAEYYSSAFEGFLIVVAAASIGYTAVERLIHPPPLEAVGIGLLVSVLASIINCGVARVLLRAGTEHKSITLEADAHHLMTDVWTSVGVIAGVTLVWLTGLKASLKAIFRSPSAVVFSIVFPFIFILVFGFIGDNGRAPIYKLVIDKNCDTTNALYDSIKVSSRIRIVSFADEKELRTALVKGRIAGILKITKAQQDTPAYTYQLSSTNASDDKWPQLLSVINALSNKVSNSKYPNRPSYAIPDRQAVQIETVREYKTIDFILPGQLGFSLLSSGVFVVAFIFFGLLNTLVLKRFFATPISRTYIVLGEAISRVILVLR